MLSRSQSHDEALKIRDEVDFFQPVRAVLIKHAPGESKTQEELDLAVRQIVSRAVASESARHAGKSNAHCLGTSGAFGLGSGGIRPVRRYLNSKALTASEPRKRRKGIQ